MKKRLFDLIPLLVMIVFSFEVTLFVLVLLNLPILLLAHIPFYLCIVLFVIKKLREKGDE